MYIDTLKNCSLLTTRSGREFKGFMQLVSVPALLPSTPLDIAVRLLVAIHMQVFGRDMRVDTLPPPTPQTRRPITPTASCQSSAFVRELVPDSRSTVSWAILTSLLPQCKSRILCQQETRERNWRSPAIGPLAKHSSAAYRARLIRQANGDVSHSARCHCDRVVCAD